MTMLPSLGTAANRGRAEDGGRVPWLQISPTTLNFGAAGSSLEAALDQYITSLNAGLDFDLASGIVAGVSAHYANSVADMTSPNGTARIGTEGFGIGGGDSPPFSKTILVRQMSADMVMADPFRRTPQKIMG